MVAFDGMTTHSIDSLSNSLRLMKESNVAVLELGPVRLSRDIGVLSALIRAITTAALSAAKGAMESGCDTSPDNNGIVSLHVLSSIQRAWPLVLFAARNHSSDEVSWWLLKESVRNFD
jgi:hypothetical protein